jgi:hypothetical protein
MHFGAPSVRRNVSTENWIPVEYKSITSNQKEIIPNESKTIGVEILTAVAMSSIFLGITQCGPMKISRRFGRTFRLNLKGKRVCQARTQQEAGSKRSKPHGVIQVCVYI